jgi:hypothetical protein
MAELFVFYHPRTTAVGLVLNFLLAGLPSLLSIASSSLVFTLALWLKGAKTSFRRVFSALAHTFFLYTFTTKVLRALVLLLGGHKDASLLEVDVASNLGFLIDARAHVALQYLLSSLDVIVFYHLYLIALALSIVARPCTFKSALWIVLPMWAIYIGAVVAVKVITQG